VRHVGATVKAGVAPLHGEGKKRALKCPDCAKVKDGGPCQKVLGPDGQHRHPYIQTQVAAKTRRTR